MPGQNPYFQKRIAELQALFEVSRGDRAVLEAPADELKRRNLPEAKGLAAEARRCGPP
jgi:hypothetical protein